MKCLECDVDCKSGKGLSNHLKRCHKVDSISYTIKHFHNGARPTCKKCGQETRYVSFTFKNYCQLCAVDAMKEGGARGGKRPAWNKNKTAENDSRIAEQSKKMIGQDNPFYGKKHSDQSKLKISKSKRLDKHNIDDRINLRKDEFDCLTPTGDYFNRQNQYLKFKCKVCDYVQEKTLQSFERGSLCDNCYPLSTSKWQLDIENWLSNFEINIKREDRTIISPKEIDIFLPDHKIGIECHGLYYHSAAKQDNNPKLHMQKANLAADAGINLLQIFYDEWIEKNEIIKGMILHRLGKKQKIVGARKCKVVVLNAKQQRTFFDSSHLSGYAPSKIAWGLVYNEEIVAALSIRTPRQKKWLERFEVSRFAVKPGYSVPGCLSKLVKQSIEYSKKNKIKGIMTYVDKRVGQGKSYISAGFKKIGETGPDYWYTDFRSRYDRFKFRAKNGMPEADVAREAKCYKIWGAGSLIFTLDF